VPVKKMDRFASMDHFGSLPKFLESNRNGKRAGKRLWPTTDQERGDDKPEHDIEKKYA
jgi:hypothetical protein